MLSLHEGRPPVYIDNRKLDGFLDFLMQSGCRGDNCGACRYCHEVAEATVEVDAQAQKERLELYERVLEDFDSGRLWSWQ